MIKSKSIVNKLKIAYSPLTGYEFAFVKSDPLIEQAMEKASLYVIGQRPVITFENVIPDESEFVLNFEIHQKGNPNILKGSLPLIQKAIDYSSDDSIAIAFNFLNKETTVSFPLNNLHGFSLVKYLEVGNEFLLWFSPEKLLQNWWNKHIECKIEGDYKSFLNYKVHYVGKATKQSILKRLTGHSTFQDILSMENPITYKDLPAHEIAVLCFEFQDNLEFQVLGDNINTSVMKAALLGENFPLQETIFLDAEKALINAMAPSYNKELFKRYPKSKDGLFKDKYDYISYSFTDPITLSYSQGSINGSLDYDGGDLIIIKGNKEVSLLKRNMI